MVEFFFVVLAQIDRFLPIMALGDAMFGFLNFGAKQRNRDRFGALADQLGLKNGEGPYEGYRLRARGDSNTIELLRPKRRRGPLHVLDRNRYSEPPGRPAAEFSAGRTLIDGYFAMRFATPALAGQIRAGGEPVEVLVGFVRRWGLRLNLCRISHKGISLALYRGSGRPPHAYMPVELFQKILPELVAVARAMEALDPGSPGGERTE